MTQQKDTIGISVTEASQKWNVARNTIYTKLSNGKLSRLSDKSIDPAEMTRVFGSPKKKKTLKVTPSDSVQKNENEQIVTLKVTLLEQQLQYEQERRKEAEKRLDNAETEKAELLKTVQDLSSTVKLLEAPKKKKGFFGLFKK